jgi:hypothetical protein
MRRAQGGGVLISIARTSDGATLAVLMLCPA